MTSETPMIVLHAAVEINGRKFEATTTAHVNMWPGFPQYQEAMKAEALRLLGEAIVDGLAPEVTVTYPKLVKESIGDFLRARDDLENRPDGKREVGD